MNLHIQNSGELVLLQKLIDYVKFVAVDEDSSMMASNPFINSLSEKVSKELLRLGVGDKNAPREYLRYNREISDMVVRKLSSLSDLEGMETKYQKKMVLTMVHPYLAAESEVEDIIDRVEEAQVTNQAELQ